MTITRPTLYSTLFRRVISSACVCVCVYSVNFPSSSHGGGGSGSADVVDALPPGCCYKSTSDLSMHGGGGGGCSTSSSASSLLLDQQQRQHVCATPSAAAGPGSMLPSFGFTQEQVRACELVRLSVTRLRRPSADRREVLTCQTHARYTYRSTS